MTGLTRKATVLSALLCFSFVGLKHSGALFRLYPPFPPILQGKVDFIPLLLYNRIASFPPKRSLPFKQTAALQNPDGRQSSLKYLNA